MRAVVVDPVTKACLDKTVGVKAANKIVSTSYKTSRMEKGRETIIWTISSAKQSEITIKNLCLHPNWLGAGDQVTRKPITERRL